MLNNFAINKNCVYQFKLIFNSFSYSQWIKINPSCWEKNAKKISWGPCARCCYLL